MAEPREQALCHQHLSSSQQPPKARPVGAQEISVLALLTLPQLTILW